MLKLSSSEMFKNEYKKFKKQIELIEDPTARNYGEKLLNDLVSQTYMIDEGHNPANNKSIEPRFLKNNIEQIVKLRVKLATLIKDSK